MPNDEADRDQKRAKILAEKGPTLEELKKGVEFRAKLIGKEEVPRPSGRAEVVKTMRRIRSEFKSRSSPKESVIFVVSVEGLAVVLMTRKTRIHRWQRQKEPLFEHSIQKILYVSHDSQDLKVFSYIGRDAEPGPFFCAVFKAERRSLAVQIVASVGLAFSSCEDPPPGLELSRKSPPEKRPLETSTSPSPISASPTTPPVTRRPPSRLRRLPATDDPLEDPVPPPVCADSALAAQHGGTNSPLGRHSLALARLALAQQAQEGEAAMAALRFLRERLASESAARAEAEGRVADLLRQNRALLEQLSALVTKLRAVEPVGGRLGALSAPGGVRDVGYASLGRVRHAESEEFLPHRFYSLPSRNVGGVLAELAAAAASDGEDPADDGSDGGSDRAGSEDSLSRQLRQWMAMCGRHEGPPDVLTPLPRLEPPPSSGGRRRPPAVPPRHSSKSSAATPL